MIEKELLKPFYQELLELIGEESMLVFHDYFRGITVNVPQNLYDGKKIQAKLQTMGDVDGQTKQQIARKYGYSQRQIERWLLATKK